MEIDILREKVNKIDTEIVKNLARRARLVKNIGKFKIENNIPINLPERDKDILESKRILAKHLNANEKYILAIYETIVVQSRKIQKGLE